MIELAIGKGRYLIFKQSPTGERLSVYTHHHGALDVESLRDDIATAHDLLRYLQTTLTKLEGTMTNA